MDTFYDIAKYMQDGCIVEFSVLSRWELVLDEICARWTFEDPMVRVKYLILDEHNTTACIISYGDFERMCNIHHAFQKNIVHMMVEVVDGILEHPSGLSMPLYMSNPFYSSPPQISAVPEYLLIHG